jgi:hypothetical protein
MAVWVRPGSLRPKGPALGGAFYKGGHGKRIVSYEAASGEPIAPLIKRNGVIIKYFSCLIGRSIYFLNQKLLKLI